MKASISNSLSARCASACPLKHTCTRKEKHRERRAKNKHATFFKKGGRFFLRSRGESKESPQLFSRISSISFFNPFSFNKITLIRKKTFIFAFDKTQPSLLLAALRCLYSAKGWAPPIPQRKRSLTYRSTTVMPSAKHSMMHPAFSGLKPAHRFTKCATSVVSFHFHHIVRQVFQKKFVFLPQTEYTHPHPLQAALA